ncbi:hypothetical protein FSP39_014977, partial [Pinctada imbricata]
LLFLSFSDVGYDGLLPAELGFINNVLNKYFQEYFPRAIQLSAYLRGAEYNERFIYTTHPWLVSLYMDCPENLVLAGIQLACPNATQKSAFVKAVQLGDITWHAGPMNMQFEMMDPSLTRFGLHLAVDLDRQFNITRKYRTLSQRDVPATTQSMIPLLKEFDIEAISVGVNAVTSPPAVPPVFQWEFQNKSVIGIWHPGGYPDDPGQIPLIPGGLSRKNCATFPGVKHALCFAFRTDNSGPPLTPQEVLAYYEVARSQFPGAVVQASTFEDFVSTLYPIKSQLPLVTKEFGDTWIQGTSSDPRKVAEFRAFMRARTKCLSEDSACNLNDTCVYNSSRFILKLAEHTWGLSSVFDKIHWTNDQFYSNMQNKSFGFLNGSLSWKEQRNFTYLALSALGNHTLASTVKEELNMINAEKPSLHDYTLVDDQTSVLSCDNGFQFQFSNGGYLNKLVDPIYKKSWASAENPVGKLVYQSLNQSDFDYFSANYPYGRRFELGIGKPNMSKNSLAKSLDWETNLVALYRKNGACSFIAHVEMSNPESMTYYGAPLIVYIKYDAEKSQSTDVAIEVQWFNKAPTRLPEAIYVVFQPMALLPDQKWTMDKLGCIVDPLNVVQNGSQRHHAINDGVYYKTDKGAGLSIQSVDCALVNILTPENGPSVIPLPLTPIKSVSGVAFNLLNNVWDVNYIFWYPFEVRDTDQKFRFNIKIE